MNDAQGTLLRLKLHPKPPLSVPSPSLVSHRIMPVLPQAAVDGDLADPLPQRILLIENSRAFTGMLREAIEQRLELPVVIASTWPRPIAC